MENTDYKKELLDCNEKLKQALASLQSMRLQLIRNEKMASLGQITAGIAHEINNPINFVYSNIKPLEEDVADLVHLVKQYWQLGPGKENDLPNKMQQLKASLDVDFIENEIKELLQGIYEGAGRTAEIIRSLADFSRVDTDSLHRLPVNEAIDSILLLLNNQIRTKSIRIVRDYTSSGDVYCYSGKIRQVLMNLLTNAVQACDTKKMGNEIVIATRAEGEFVSISVTDNGNGISEDMRTRIFEPFFSTKNNEEGDGLRLYIVQEIIKEHGGTISVSHLLPGTCFCITIPRELILHAASNAQNE